MPSYSRLSRSALLALAGPLIARARRCRSEAVVLAAADDAEAARIGLEGALRGRRFAGAAADGAAVEAELAERSLDRRVRALHRALDGLAELGDSEAEATRDRLFPSGTEAMRRRAGRAQVPEYRLLASGLHAYATEGALVRFAPFVGRLRGDLLRFVEAHSEPAADHSEATDAVRGVTEAAEALRAALLQLDRTVELVCGGTAEAGYQAWAEAARGLG